MAGGISGQVEGSRGEPLGCAAVLYDGQVVGLTADDGAFSLGNVPAGPHSIAATVDGFAQASQQVMVADGQTAQVTLQLHPDVPAAITGTVVDEQERTPVAGAAVTLDLGAAQRTDADGGFDFEGTDPGAHVVGVQATGYQPASWAVVALPGQTVRGVVALRSSSAVPGTPGAGAGAPAASGLGRVLAFAGGIALVAALL